MLVSRWPCSAECFGGVFRPFGNCIPLSFQHNILDHFYESFSSFLTAQRSSKESSDHRVPLVCTCSSRLQPLRQLMNSAFPLLQANDRLLHLFQQLLISFRRPRNLRNLLRLCARNKLLKIITVGELTRLSDRILVVQARAKLVHSYTTLPKLI